MRASISAGLRSTRPGAAAASRALIACVEAEARRRDLGRIRLQVRIPLVGNQALFKSCGFVEVARESHPGYTEPTTIRMEKRLK